MSVAGCQDPLASAEESQLARDHLDQILELMETYSVNRNTIDWPTFRTTVLAKAPDPGRLDDTFDAIFTALGLLGDNHSSYVAPAGVWHLNHQLEDHVHCIGRLE